MREPSLLKTGSPSNLAAAVTRRRPDSYPGPEGWYPAERISLQEALKAYTHGAAYTAGMVLFEIPTGVLADVRQGDLYELWQALQGAGLATANIGYLTDMICCPGGDFCSLANDKSVPVAEAIQARFDDMDYVYDLGPIEINISGCMNACGHHHIGHIGVLGVDKKGQEFYQVSLGGSQAKDRTDLVEDVIEHLVWPLMLGAEDP